MEARVAQAKANLFPFGFFTGSKSASVFSVVGWLGLTSLSEFRPADMIYTPKQREGETKSWFKLSSASVVPLFWINSCSHASLKLGMQP